MPRPIQAIIHQAALTHNLAAARRCAPQSKVWAVVKANAYGHGLARVYRALRSADGFALLDLNEAILLRELGWEGPILLLEGFFKAGDLAVLDHYRIGTTVHCDAQLRMLAAHRFVQPIDVHLKLNSGMNRLGFTATAYRQAWQALYDLPQVAGITLMTHFSDADGPRGIAEQRAVFEQASEGLAAPRSLANSAATLWHPDTHGDWVRPGIMLYGASPSGDAEDIADVGLQPTMTLSSEIIAVQTLKAGDAVGYGGRFVAERPMRVGVVACGYADGYPRHAQNSTPVAVDDVRTRVVGRVSMDMITVDLTPCPQAGIGSTVELWGRQVHIDEVAKVSGTLGYELMCALAQRVPVSVE